MFKGTLMYVPRSKAVVHAASFLQGIGIPVTEKAGPDITHLLLPVPSFPEGDEYLAYILSDLPDDVVVSGGNLRSALLENYPVVDFLQDPFYLAENAAITARCALEMIRKHIPVLTGCKTLILGWGRIGKCLAQLLSAVGSEVTVAVRKTPDAAILRALGYKSEFISHIPDSVGRFSLIINTVPELILPNISCRPECLAIDLASHPGMTGDKILTARGLPGKMAPEESGQLIAKTFIRLSI